MRKMLRRREPFPAVEGGSEIVLTATLRKGHHDLPIFFNELNVRSTRTMPRSARRALLARQDDKKEVELYPLAQAR